MTPKMANALEGSARVRTFEMQETGLQCLCEVGLAYRIVRKGAEKGNDSFSRLISTRFLFVFGETHRAIPMAG